MNTFSFTAKDSLNPLTDMLERLEGANKINNLCLFADGYVFTPDTANEIYNYFNGGLRFIVGTNASYKNGFEPVFLDMYNASSFELLRSEPVATEDQETVSIYVPNFEVYFSEQAQTEIKTFIGGTYL